MKIRKATAICTLLGLHSGSQKHLAQNTCNPASLASTLNTGEDRFHLSDLAKSTRLIAASALVLCGSLLPQTEAMAQPIVENGDSIYLIGNSFIGNNGGQHALLPVVFSNGDVPYGINTVVGGGNYFFNMGLGSMFTTTVQNEIANNNYDFVVNISGPTSTMNQFATASANAGSQNVIFMIWELTHPTTSNWTSSWNSYRNGTVSIINSVRSMESSTDAIVAPVGAVLYDLLADPVRSGLPVNYVFEWNENGTPNIHQNFLGQLVGAYTLYALLTGESPVGINFTFSLFGNTYVDEPLLWTARIGVHPFDYDEAFRLDVQDRVWKVLNEWNDNTFVVKPAPPQTGGNQRPNAVITPSVVSGNAPLSVDFSAASSSDPDSDPLTYTWDFDDGNDFVAGDEEELVVFTTPGTYRVGLRADDGERYDSDFVIITVAPGSSGGGTSFSQYRLNITQGTSGAWGRITELDWIAGSTEHPTTHYTASSSDVTSTGNNGWQAYDGSTSSFWDLMGTTGNITINLGTAQPITAVRIRVGADNRAPAAFAISGSNDGTNWTDLGTVSGLTTGSWSSLDQTFNLTLPNSIPEITTTSLPNGAIGIAYSQTLAATGGDGSLSWSITAGSLPAGLSLSSAGVISGTPTASGTSNFTVRVADQDNDADTQALSITIPAPPSSFTMLQLQVTQGTTGSWGRVGEIDWLVGSTSYPDPHFTGTTSSVTGTGTVGWEAYDNSTAAGSYWDLQGTSGTLTLTLSSAVAPTSVRIQVPESGRAPSSFTLRGSNDGTNWTVLGTFSGETQSAWSGLDRTFSLSY